MMDAIATDPHRVPFMRPAVKSQLLKIGPYALWHKRQRIARALGNSQAVNYEQRHVSEPGGDIFKIVTPRLCSLGQFWFIDERQLRIWDRTYEKLKRDFNCTFEMFFLNQDWTVDYLRMARTIDELIRSGCYHPLRALDNNGRIRRYVAAAGRQFPPAEYRYAATKALARILMKETTLDWSFVGDDVYIDDDDEEQFYDELDEATLDGSLGI
jgi:hypothetical protein